MYDLYVDCVTENKNFLHSSSYSPSTGVGLTFANLSSPYCMADSLIYDSPESENGINSSSKRVTTVGEKRIIIGHSFLFFSLSLSFIFCNFFFHAPLTVTGMTRFVNFPMHFHASRYDNKIVCGDWSNVLYNPTFLSRYPEAYLCTILLFMYLSVVRLRHPH